ncbi:MAG: metallophosphoesterase family protein [Anaerolineae bacterium]
MKIAVLADIHGNLPALEAVAAHIDAWQPEAVIVGGDIVNRGPRSLDCLRFVQERQRRQGWQVVRGNHEDYVIFQGSPETPRSGPAFELFGPANFAYRQLDGQVSALEKMPFQTSLAAPDGSELRVTHASMGGIRDGIFPETSDESLRRKIIPPPAVLCVGHTHRPLIRQVDQTLVVNVGAVGAPFDGDLRAGYAQLCWQRGGWRVEIIRLDYDRAQTERDFFETGFVAESGPVSHIMLAELRAARSYLYLWMHRYEAPVLAGEVTIEEAVNEYLAELGVTVSG